MMEVFCLSEERATEICQCACLLDFSRICCFGLLYCSSKFLTTLQCRQLRFNCANKNGFVQDEILVCRILLTLNSEFLVQLDFASSMGFVILLPKKKVMCPCSELKILRRFANMAFIYWLLSRAQVRPIVWVFFSTS